MALANTTWDDYSPRGSSWGHAPLRQNTLLPLIAGALLACAGVAALLVSQSIDLSRLGAPATQPAAMSQSLLVETAPPIDPARAWLEADSQIFLAQSLSLSGSAAKLEIAEAKHNGRFGVRGVATSPAGAPLMMGLKLQKHFTVPKPVVAAPIAIAPVVPAMAPPQTVLPKIPPVVVNPPVAPLAAAPALEQPLPPAIATTSPLAAATDDDLPTPAGNPDVTYSTPPDAALADALPDAAMPDATPLAAAPEAPVRIAPPVVVPLPTPAFRTDRPLVDAPPMEQASIPNAERPAIPVLNPAIGRNDGTAVYDITAAVVYLPNGERLEAHSGLGYMTDNPRYVDRRNTGSTPPGTYNLVGLNSLFFGVEALRMVPTSGVQTFGRDGFLTHTYLLRGRPGQSNGCVVFPQYQRFLDAYHRGQVKRLVVVSSLTGSPLRTALLSK